MSPLYILYINDLQTCPVNSHPRLYADETHLTFASTDVAHIKENMNYVLTRITEWLKENKLTLISQRKSFYVDWFKANV